MADMTTVQRAQTHAELMREFSDSRTSCSLTKLQLRAALDAADTWVSANAAAFNTALPVAARTALSATDKAKLLMFVVAKRFKVGAV